MLEHRKYQRFQCYRELKSHVLCSGMKEEAPVIDVCANGMKVSLSRITEIGADLYGKLHLLPESGPFFVRGKVTRVVEKEGKWETAIRFEKISTFPFVIMNMYQMA
jgi:hypothetical protein